MLYANPAAETLLAHGRKHLIGIGIDKALPGNPEFIERLMLSLDHEAAGFNEHDLELDVSAERIHVHCVMTPLEEDGAGGNFRVAAGAAPVASAG